MISENAVNFLGLLGDPIEKEGILEHQLGQIFPKYAEFWINYVFPNRDTHDPSKLYPGFPIEIEDICNNHYYTFYQLTVAYRQIRALPSPLIDVGDPFFHLGTAVDMTERTFVSAFQLKSQLMGLSFSSRLSETEYRTKVDKFWPEDYLGQVKQFERNYQPVSLNFHTVGEIFKNLVPESQFKKDLKRCSRQIRNYRNIMIHNLSPLKLTDSNIEYLPQEKFLKHYVDGRWSSNRHLTNPDHFAPASQIISGLAEKLIIASNNIWESLIETMSYIAAHDNYSGVFRSVRDYFSSTGSGSSPKHLFEQKDAYTSEDEKFMYSIKHPLPLFPSGYKYEPFNIPGTGTITIENLPKPEDE